MKKLIPICLMAFGVIIFGCEKKGEDQKKGETNKEEFEASSLGEPRDYLQMKVGTTWTYKIEIGEVEPLYYQLVTWPMGDSGVSYATRGRYYSHLQDPNQKTFCLKKRIKGKAEKQGILQYPFGVELEIQKDDLGIYSESKQIFWAAGASGRFMAHEVVTFDSSHSPNSGSWGSWGSEDGYSMPILFFGESPGIEISLGEKSKDKLLFEGMSLVPGTNVKGLHFVRNVSADEKSEGVLNKSFTEDKYFVRGKGLVYLQQKIEGNVSMTWTLNEFSSGL